MHIKPFLALVLLVLTGLPSIAAEDKDPDNYKEERLPNGYVRSTEAFNSGFHPTATSLWMHAELETRYGHSDKAIHICQKALEKDPEDMDAHLRYAEALEHKLTHQKVSEKDLNLFLATVREWLIVLRGERGEEKGMVNTDGRGIPGITWMFRDDERAIKAKKRIVALCGRSPKWHESDKKFMHEMYVRASEGVRGEVLAPEKASTTESSTAVKGVSMKIVPSPSKPQ